MTKYLILSHGDTHDSYDSLDDLLKNEYFFKKMYHMASSHIIKIEELSEEEERIVDARSWEIRDWGYYPKPNNSLNGTLIYKGDKLSCE